MKVALLVGVEIHVNVSFDGLIEPTEEQSNGKHRILIAEGSQFVQLYVIFFSLKSVDKVFLHQ